MEQGVQTKPGRESAVQGREHVKGQQGSSGAPGRHLAQLGGVEVGAGEHKGNFLKEVVSEHWVY